MFGRDVLVLLCCARQEFVFFAEVGGGRDGVGVGCALGGTERVPLPAVDDGLQL